MQSPKRCVLSFLDKIGTMDIVQNLSFNYPLFSFICIPFSSLSLYLFIYLFIPPMIIFLHVS
jgi:hypothetical protein